MARQKSYQGKFTFSSARKKAMGYIRNPEKFMRLLEEVNKKIRTFAFKNDKLKELYERIVLFSRMAKAYYKKEYTEVSTKSIVLIVAGLLYFVAPFDVIPDFIPFTGLLDDATVMLWVFSMIGDDLRLFEVWEKENK